MFRMLKQIRKVIVAIPFLGLILFCAMWSNSAMAQECETFGNFPERQSDVMTHDNFGTVVLSNRTNSLVHRVNDRQCFYLEFGKSWETKKIRVLFNNKSNQTDLTEHASFLAVQIVKVYKLTPASGSTVDALRKGNWYSLLNGIELPLENLNLTSFNEMTANDFANLHSGRVTRRELRVMHDALGEKEFHGRLGNTNIKSLREIKVWQPGIYQFDRATIENRLWEFQILEADQEGINDNLGIPFDFMVSEGMEEIAVRVYSPALATKFTEFRFVTKNR